MCSKCGMPFEGIGENHLCLTCAKEPPPFEKARALFHYGGAVAEAIQRFKYGPLPELARPLGKMLEQLVRDETQVDAVVPVPLHEKKLRARGFNQSSLLAGYASDRLCVPLCPGFLTRTRNTASQAGLTRAERMENIRGAFEVPVSRRLDGLKVLLVDDVITSSATVREAANTLIQAGSKSVEIIALARATGSAALLAPSP
jgi:ComF family protein